MSTARSVATLDERLSLDANNDEEKHFVYAERAGSIPVNHLACTGARTFRPDRARNWEQHLPDQVAKVIESVAGAPEK